MAEIEITLPDGSTRALPSGTTAADLARDIGSRLAKSSTSPGTSVQICET